MTKTTRARLTTARRAIGTDSTSSWTEVFREPTAEWLEADGLGGFASGCAGGVRTRRYHALLLSALTPPTGRHVLVNDVEAMVETDAGPRALSSHRYAGDVVHPDGAARISGFRPAPWPCWRFRLDDGAEIEHERFVPHGSAAVVLRWTLTGSAGTANLVVRPLLSGRDAHALMRENPAFRFDADTSAGRVAWRPYPGLPEIAAYSNGAYAHAPDWYRNFLYTEERARGLDDLEDLASPGVFRFDLARGTAVLVFSAEPGPGIDPALERLRAAAARSGDRRSSGIMTAARTLAAAEGRRRARFATRLHRAAADYLVKRGTGMTIVAGYPWFTDWGRDTFIALRGLCLAGDRLEDAGAILREWSGHVSEGMLPNRFVDAGDAPEFNSVDASLWFVIAVAEYCDAMTRAGHDPAAGEREALGTAVEAVLDGFSRGTRHGIRLDGDGLLAAGEPGVQLTWMDAKIGDWVVTPRIGKPVEVQALWLNALRAAKRFSTRWEPTFERGADEFRRRFWNERTGALYDVVDVNHVPGAVDESIRPNMLLAVGGLPVGLIDGARARSIVDVAEAELWTPLGPRSLSPGHPDYRGVYAGGPRERDGAYHQGTVWPWLAGPFVEAWVRVRGSTLKAKREARERFVEPLLRHLDEAGLDHVSEIADGDRPHTPRGCPFQAWSVGELLRLVERVLADAPSRRRPRPRAGALAAADGRKGASPGSTAWLTASRRRG